MNLSFCICSTLDMYLYLFSLHVGTHTSLWIYLCVFVLLLVCTYLCLFSLLVGTHISLSIYLCVVVLLLLVCTYLYLLSLHEGTYITLPIYICVFVLRCVCRSLSFYVLSPSICMYLSSCRHLYHSISLEFIFFLSRYVSIYSCTKVYISFYLHEVISVYVSLLLLHEVPISLFPR